MKKINTIAVLLPLLSFTAHAIEVTGANAVLDQSWSPRESSLGRALLGQPGSADSWLTDPAGLADLNSHALILTHARAPLETQYHSIDGVFVLRPARASLAFSIGRFASENIPKVDSLEIVEGSNYRTFDIQDLLARGAFAQRIGFFQWGGIVNLLYRDLDQSGLGFRADVSAKALLGAWRLGAQIDGITSSLARWQSEVLEYSPPEMKIGLGYHYAVPYFYGDLSLSWQSAGIFQTGAKGLVALDSKADGTGELRGRRAWEEPLEWIQSSAMGIEYRGNSGLLLSVGNRDLSSIRTYGWGAGFNFSHWTVQYALEGHPDLGNTHRFALSFALDVPTIAPAPEETPSVKMMDQPTEAEPIVLPKDESPKTVEPVQIQQAPEVIE